VKKILQNLSNGETSLVDIPSPLLTKENILIATKKSLVSSGTERMLVDFGRSNIINKARKQPDKVKMVIDKVRTDGFAPTLSAVRAKLDQPLPLGYCNAGVVLKSNVNGINAGDRVVSNGSHAEVVRVAKNLCVKIPFNVDDESAAFTVLGSIGLQGIRLIQPTIGECFVVTGLGLVGLMCVQILRANGCRVLGIDFDTKKCTLAREFGAEIVDLSLDEDPIVIANAFSRGRGVDGVLITASSESNEVIHQSAQMCRKRGRIVLVGVVGLNLKRDDFFEKEISFQVSASYGPGRYDSFYEEEGNDYPVGFVRWTEQRNFEAVLDMMSSGSLNVKSLITHRYDIDNAIEAYKLLNDSAALGILINYHNEDPNILIRSKVELNKTNNIVDGSSMPCIGFIGAGNYASRILIPSFKKAGAILDTLVSSGGVSSVYHGKKNKFITASTATSDLWSNEKINTVVIATRHDAHAQQAIKALNSIKNVFIEKPLALTLDELSEIDKAYKKANTTCAIRLMVGFNRRFAPHILKIKALLENRKSPKSIIMIVNAGDIPKDHWVHDIQIGGGRVIGEVCHFIDLLKYLIGHKIVDFKSTMIGSAPGIYIREDKTTITLSFEDGSFGTIHYFANGGSALSKERIEVFCDNAVLQMDNYRVLKGYGWAGFKKMKLFRQDKGQEACAKAFVESIISGKESPISYDDIMESSRVAIEVSDSLHN